MRAARRVGNHCVVQHLAVGEDQRDQQGEHQDGRHAQPRAVGLGPPQRGHQRREQQGQDEQRRQPSAHAVGRCAQQRRGQRGDQAADEGIGGDHRLALDRIAHQHGRHIGHEDVDADEGDVGVATALVAGPGAGAGGHGPLGAGGGDIERDGAHGGLRTSRSRSRRTCAARSGSRCSCRSAPPSGSSRSSCGCCSDCAPTASAHSDWACWQNPGWR